MTSTFYSRMSPQLWLTQYLGKLIFWIINMHSWVAKRKIRKNLSFEQKYPSISHVSPNVEDSSPIHCMNFKPTKKNPHKSIKGLQVQPIAQVAFDCIFMGKSSHIALPCSQLVSLSLITVSTPGYKGNCKSKVEIKCVSECRQLSYCYRLCFPNTWDVVYSTQVA